VRRRQQPHEVWQKVGQMNHGTPHRIWYLSVGPQLSTP
jgi:hypothetical protein